MRSLDVRPLTLGIFVLAAAAAAAAEGVLVSNTIELRTSKDEAASKIVNHAVRRCKYLNLLGLREREKSADDGEANCALFALSEGVSGR